MNRVTYQDLGIPEAHHFESYHYLPARNIGACVFHRTGKPSVNRVFWRHFDQSKYNQIPVSDTNHSLDSCMAASNSSNLYYSLMHWRSVGEPPHFGGYWVSLNRFNVDSQREEILLDQPALDQMTNTERSWISRIVYVTPDENEIDVIAGISVPAGDSEERMNYGVYRFNLERRSFTARMPLPAVFV